MLPMRFFRSRAFAAANLTALLMYAALFGSLFLLTQLLQTGLGASPLDAGVRMLPMVVMPMLLAPVGGALSDRWGTRPVMVTGVALVAAGLAWLAAVTSLDVAYAELVPAMILMGGGSALFFAPVAATVLGAVAPAEHGQASGAATAVREIAVVLGVAVLASVFASHGDLGSPTGCRRGRRARVVAGRCPRVGRRADRARAAAPAAGPRGGGRGRVDRRQAGADVGWPRAGRQRPAAEPAPVADAPREPAPGPQPCRPDPRQEDHDMLTHDRRPRVSTPFVRHAWAAEHPAIRTLLLAAYGQYSGDVAPEVWRTYLSDLLDLDRHAREGELLVAVVDGEVAGCAAFYPDASVQGFGWPAGWAGGRGLAVHPDYRGHGVAAALLGALERRARAAGAPVYAFHTSEFMTTAVALYERLGYRRAPEFDVDVNAHYGVRATRPWTAVAYLKPLSADVAEAA